MTDLVRNGGTDKFRIYNSQFHNLLAAYLSGPHRVVVELVVYGFMVLTKLLGIAVYDDLKWHVSRSNLHWKMDLEASQNWTFESSEEVQK